MIVPLAVFSAGAIFLSPVSFALMRRYRLRGVATMAVTLTVWAAFSFGWSEGRFDAESFLFGLALSPLVVASFMAWVLLGGVLIRRIWRR